ncbi:hypothetical protein C8R43DRAFT_891698 [Mycena crocata]|nr:hypothetical protein C8R43DRAFT_891698 [Mycena crocata]
MTFPPPVYSPSIPCPSYSATPDRNERIVQYTPLPHRSRPTATFIRKEHNITVVLDGQKENSQLPSFGRGALLTGTLLLESHETVAAVTITFQGVLESLSLSHGYSTLKIVDQSSCLYTKNGSQTSCPSSIPFSQRFPSTFENNGLHYPLPPSSDITLPGGSFLKCTFSLTVTVISALHRSASFLSKERRLSIELEHRQRTRPSRPRIPDPSLFSTIKACPEEWLQLPVDLTNGPNSGPSDVQFDVRLPFPPLNCNQTPLCYQLFVPSVGVFGISEIVPFHLQLSGSIYSLQQLFLLPNLERQTSYDES